MLAQAAALALAGRCRPAVADGRHGIPDGGRLAFDVIREGERIGTHALRFTQSGGVLAVEITVALQVTLGPVTLFRYRHHALERWRDGVFVALETRTDDDGTPVWVQAARQPDGIRIAAARGPKIAPPLLLPAATLPLSHWNRAVTRSALFDPQDGVAMHETVAARGASPVTVAGRSVDAERFDFAGQVTLSNWYDATDGWVALRATVKDGSVLEYHRTA